MTEKQIESAIIEALRTLGFLVTKTSQPRPSMITRGTPDLFAAHPLWMIQTWFEVKTAKGKTSMYQDAWHNAVRAAGGNVAVVRSVADVLAEIRRLGAPIT